MNVHQIGQKIIDQFEDIEVKQAPGNLDALLVPASGYRRIAEYLKSDEELDFNFLEFQTATDRPPDTLDVLTYLFSYQHRHRVALKVELDRVAPSLDSLADLWANAEWNEREVYDLFGVVFHNHPDLRRIMMPEDWHGYPLRKDYIHPNVVKRPD